jgi:NADP-dependent 3-hydroxy acid dehydrogenase YdfG
MSKSAANVITGRTVVITGAASGIGRALAQRLSSRGCPVAIADVDERGLKETEASLAGPTLTRPLDVRDAAAQHAFAGEVRDWAPEPLGAVFNNAGVAVSSSVLDSVVEDDDWLWDINFHGVVNGTRAFLPILAAQDSGAIVNTSSVFGLVGMPNQSAYCSAKFAVRGFTDSLRQELRGTGVRAINVHPGGINTNIVRNARFRKDPNGGGRSHDQLVAEFAARQGGRGHPPRCGAGEGAHSHRPGCLRVRRARQAGADPLLRHPERVPIAAARTCAGGPRQTVRTRGARLERDTL